MSTPITPSLSNHARDRSLAVLAFASMPLFTPQVARADDDVRALHRVDIQDVEGFHYELRDDRDVVVDSCRAPCALQAPAGRYRIVAIRHERREELDVALTDSLEVRRESANYGGVIAGIPLMLVGSFALIGALSFATEPQSPNHSTALGSTGALVFFGAALSGVGIALSATSHGASLEVYTKHADAAPLMLSIAPVFGGGSLQLVGAF
ncbi:MAG: hypothetical protein ACHREM_28235 [Polyangiales bacterium]